MDISVERNKQIMLHCQAEGVPTPAVVWKKSIGSLNTLNWIIRKILMSINSMT